VLEEFGINWHRLKCVHEFLKTLCDIENEDWISPHARAVVRKDLLVQLKHARNIESSVSGLCSLLSQLCHVLLGRTPQPLAKYNTTRQCTDDETAPLHALRADVKIEEATLSADVKIEAGEEDAPAPEEEQAGETRTNGKARVAADAMRLEYMCDGCAKSFPTHQVLYTHASRSVHVCVSA
jgi:hypothetical protein